MPVRQVLQDLGRPVKIWTDEFEDKARAQLLNVSRLPFIHHHVAAMPDVHTGIGATVGSVIATHRAIIPAAVGVDIGCGMCAARTSLTANDLDESRLKKVFDQISRDVGIVLTVAIVSFALGPRTFRPSVFGKVATAERVREDADDLRSGAERCTARRFGGQLGHEPDGDHAKPAGRTTRRRTKSHIVEDDAAPLPQVLQCRREPDRDISAHGRRRLRDTGDLLAGNVEGDRLCVRAAEVDGEGQGHL